MWEMCEKARFKAESRITVLWSDFDNDLEVIAYTTYSSYRGLLPMSDREKLKGMGVEFSPIYNPFNRANRKDN